MDERLQIERFREIDAEELEVEEVDDDDHHSSSECSSETHGDGSRTFNTELASLHTYLGDVDDTHHTMLLLDGDAVVELPMVYLEGVVLFPEATIPIRVIQPSHVSAVERSMTLDDAICLLGVVRYHRSPTDGPCLAPIGTTAEIKQFRFLQDGSLNVVARGRQRFHVLKSWIDVEGAPRAEVKIIKEEIPLRMPRDAFGQLASVVNLQSGRTSCQLRPDTHHAHEGSERGYQSIKIDHLVEESNMPESAVSWDDEFERIDEYSDAESDQVLSRSPVQNLESRVSGSDIFEIDTDTNREIIPGRQFADTGVKASRKIWVDDESRCLRRPPKSFWPYWVYRMYDANILARRAADMWRQIIGHPNLDSLIRKPDFLSLFIASKIPVSDSIRQELLEIDGLSYRLQRELELLERFDTVRCKHCLTMIARRSDVVIMSRDGPSNAFVNPHGYVHEIMTFNNTKSLAPVGSPVAEYSWFPGYAWTILNCAVCESNMGWLFTATNRRLQPRSFWAVRSSQIADDM